MMSLATSATNHFERKTSFSGAASRQPSLEMDKSVWEIGVSASSCTVSAELELDISMFGKQEYSIGFSLIDETGNRVDWQQDGPGNYYRARSFIRIHPRLIVDRSAFVKVSVVVPPQLLPELGQSKTFTIGVKAYALDDPFNASTPVSAPFMVLRPWNAGRRGSLRS